MTALQNRLAEARARLHTALLKGENTEAHRQAIRRIEADIASTADRERQARETLTASTHATITERARQHVADIQARIDALMLPLPIYPFQRSQQ